MTLRIKAVSNVLSPFPDPVVTVEYGDDSRDTFTLAGWFYEPQIGDQILVDTDSIKGQPFPVRLLTTNRAPNLNPLALTITTSSTPPAGMQAATSVFVAPGRIVATVSPTPPSTAGSAKFVPVASHTYDATNGWGRSDSYLRQGAYPGGPPGTGLWFYDTADIAAKLAGKTLTGISVIVKRVEEIGDPYAPKPIFVVGHSYATQPTAPPNVTQVVPGSVGSLGTGDQLAFALPLSVASALQSGSILGLGVASASSGDYLAVYGAGTASGTITVTWSA